MPGAQSAFIDRLFAANPVAEPRMRAAALLATSRARTATAILGATFFGAWTDLLTQRPQREDDRFADVVLFRRAAAAVAAEACVSEVTLGIVSGEDVASRLRASERGQLATVGIEDERTVLVE